MIESTLVEITDRWLHLSTKGNVRFFTSLEGENPGGSIKDHMVEAELESLLRAGRLVPGDCIAELSSGSTARALAYYAKQMGLQCRLFLPASASNEIASELVSLGADVQRVDVSDVRKAYADFDDYCHANHCVAFNQMGDLTKQRHYRALGQVAHRRLGEISAVIGGVGTGHSLLGVADELSKARALTAEPASAPVPGIFNLDSPTWLGDSTRILSRISGRLVVDPSEAFPGSAVMTSVGSVSISPSFAIVLGAARRLLSAGLLASGTTFLIGAANRRSLR